jgi:hypothetical protein
MNRIKLTISTTELLIGDEMVGFSTPVRSVSIDGAKIFVTFESGEETETSGHFNCTVMHVADAATLGAVKALADRNKAQQALYAGECRTVASALDNLGVATLAARQPTRHSVKALDEQRAAVDSALTSFILIVQSFDWALISRHAVELHMAIPLGVYGSEELMNLASRFRNKATAAEAL